MKTRKLLVLLLIFCMFPIAAYGVPSLQLKVDGTYDTETETWVTNDNPFTLYVAGAKSPANAIIITDVKLFVSVPIGEYNAGGSITITGSSADVAGFSATLGAGGAAPDGAPGKPAPQVMPPHGIFPAYYWIVNLADLLISTAGETVDDYKPGCAPGEGSATGDIQLYDIAVSGFDLVHFDLGGTLHKLKGNGDIQTSVINAPFSHDAEYDPHVPAPSALLLVAFGVGALGIARRKLR